MFESYKRATNAIVSLVNRTGASGNRAVATLASKEVQEKFLNAARRCATYGLALGAYSELSLRLNKTHFLTLKQGTPLAEARSDDLVILNVTPTGEDMPQFSPSNVVLHQLVYAATAQNAVLFCHPRYASLVLSSGSMPDFACLPGLEALAGTVTLCALSNLEASLGDTQQLYLRDLGLLSLGSTPYQALERATYLEWICWQNLHARGMTFEPT